MILEPQPNIPEGWFFLLENGWSVVRSARFSHDFEIYFAGKIQNYLAMAWDLGPTPTPHPQIITDAGDITVSPQLGLLEPIATGWFQKGNDKIFTSSCTVSLGIRRPHHLGSLEIQCELVTNVLWGSLPKSLLVLRSYALMGVPVCVFLLLLLSFLLSSLSSLLLLCRYVENKLSIIWLSFVIQNLYNSQHVGVGQNKWLANPAKIEWFWVQRNDMTTDDHRSENGTTQWLDQCPNHPVRLSEVEGRSACAPGNSRLIQGDVEMSVLGERWENGGQIWMIRSITTHNMISNMCKNVEK